MQPSLDERVGWHRCAVASGVGVLMVPPPADWAIDDGDRRDYPASISDIPHARRGAGVCKLSSTLGWVRVGLPRAGLDVRGWLRLGGDGLRVVLAVLASPTTTRSSL